jgi:hypothetical protein
MVRFLCRVGCDQILQQIRVTSPLTRGDMTAMIEVAGTGRPAGRQQRDSARMIRFEGLWTNTMAKEVIGHSDAERR